MAPVFLLAGAALGGAVSVPHRSQRSASTDGVFRRHRPSPPAATPAPHPPPPIDPEGAGDQSAEAVAEDSFLKFNSDPVPRAVSSRQLRDAADRGHRKPPPKPGQPAPLPSGADVPPAKPFAFNATAAAAPAVAPGVNLYQLLQSFRR